MKPMKIIIEGPITPAVRMTQRSKYTDPQAEKYLTCKEAIRMQAMAQVAAMMPDRTPLKIDVRFFVSKRLHGKDIDNMFKSVTDALQGIAYKNDSWLDQAAIAKYPNETDQTVVYIEELA